MPSRIGAALVARVRRVDMNHQPRRTVFLPLLAAMTQRIARGEQCMVLLNRRGYAPVLHCQDCGWKSDCPHCSAHQVFHKSTAACAATTAALPCAYRTPARLRQPRHRGPWGGQPSSSKNNWPPCWPTCSADGSPDARGAHRRRQHPRWGRCKSQLAQVHAGEVDVLVGTQMIARATTFGASPWWRRCGRRRPVLQRFSGAERLLALLIQAAGQAGRDAAYMAAQGTQCGCGCRAFTRATPCSRPCTHDYPAFAAQQLKERRAAMPPFAFQALVRADARTQEVVGFSARRQQRRAGPRAARVWTRSRSTRRCRSPSSALAQVERARCWSSSNRTALQRFLAAWQPVLQATPAPA